MGTISGLKTLIVPTLQRGNASQDALRPAVMWRRASRVACPRSVGRISALEIPDRLQRAKVSASN